MNINKCKAEARMIQVIEVVYMKGLGTKESPCRKATAYFHADGRMIAEEDPATENEGDLKLAGELCYWLRELYDYCPLSPSDEREATYREVIGIVLKKAEKAIPRELISPQVEEKS